MAHPNQTESESTKARRQTSQNLRWQLGQLQGELVEAKRAQNLARTSLPGHIAGGDSAAIDECRAEIKATAKRIRELEAEVETMRDAVGVAEGLEQGEVNRKAYRRLQQVIATAARRAEDLEDAIDGVCKALLDAHESQKKLVEEFTQCGLNDDPYLLRGRLVGLAQLRLAHRSNGVFGQARTLLSEHELEQTGATSLRRQAAEFREVTLRSVRLALGIPNDSSEVSRHD